MAALVVREVVVWQRQDSIPCCRSGPLRQLARSSIRFDGFIMGLEGYCPCCNCPPDETKSHSDETTTSIPMLQGFGSWAVRFARCTPLVIGFRHENRKLGQELNIVILGRLLRGWWLDSRPCGFVIIVVVIFILAKCNKVLRFTCNSR